MITELNSLEAYCRHIHIPAPKYPDFDIRRFEDNMLSVKTQVEPFHWTSGTQFDFYEQPDKVEESVEQVVSWLKNP